MGQQSVKRLAPGVAVERICIEVAGDQERRALRQRAGATLIVGHPALARHVVDPEPHLVMVAASVAILRPVEDRRRRMTDQHVQAAAVRQDDRRVPMGFRRKG